MKFMFFEVSYFCKEWNSCCLNVFTLAKNEIHVFWGFWSLEKWNSCFLRFFELARNEIHVFWGFWNLQKMKFMVFKKCSKVTEKGTPERYLRFPCSICIINNEHMIYFVFSTLYKFFIGSPISDLRFLQKYVQKKSIWIY